MFMWKPEASVGWSSTVLYSIYSETEFPHQTWSSLAGTAVSKLQGSSRLCPLTSNCWVADICYQAQLWRTLEI